MPKANWLSDMEIDEISTVDLPAGPDARIAIAKRANEEDNVPEYFDQSGDVLDDSDLEDLKEGDVVFDKDGQAFVATFQDEEQDESESKQKEPEPVGKSLGDEIRKSLAQSLSDVQRDEVIAKAADAVSAAEKRAEEAERIAKGERDVRLEREYISKAAEYNVPIEAGELGPVLKRMAEAMSFEDCEVIHKALTSSGEALFAEVGTIGGGDNNDPMAQVEAAIEAGIQKNADGGKISKAEATTEFFTQNPEAYDEWLAGRGN